MSRIKPLVRHFENASDLKAAKEDYDYIGRDTETDFEKLTLTVLVYPRWSKKKAKQNARLARLRKEKNAYEYGDDEPTYEDKYGEDR